ncbi:polysaccharide deacetylase family protein [Anaerobranca gottschalkii]|uniref:Probable sporulation protein, polysaccharide deacetylase family n=1 Tax=Anaerobranca gottschalkii DSM 13577 TaxID=1120990 RepID=A0A1H9Z8Y7_9FIRM|nr:polysaccharide deacetylase family protein [Anaerobranca gottschalkii]SES78008.1 probable sporulation protein, polysaccharide deacetylase family [Anaerobranca gottschalkii DSM 13577]
MSVYIKSITLARLLTSLLLLITSISLVIFVSYQIHNSITTVKSNVTMGTINFGGLKKDDVEKYLNSIAHEFYNEPQNAYIDPETKSLIPHLNGTVLNIEETKNKIVKAKKGQLVVPVIDIIKPEKTISDFGNIPIYQGHPIKKQVALVINVSWGNEFNNYLREMLDILEDNEVKGNFFLVGKWAEKYPDLVLEIYQKGHQFGNHGYSDPYMSKLTPEAISEEIQKTNAIIFNITGYKPKYFSPPYGEKEEKIFTQSFKDNMINVLWSLDTIDWMRPGPEKMAQRVLSKLHNGAIILMHNTEQTPEGLKLIIKGIKEQGYEIVTIDELLCPDFFAKKLQKKIDLDFLEN